MKPIKLIFLLFVVIAISLISVQGVMAGGYWSNLQLSISTPCDLGYSIPCACAGGYINVTVSGTYHLRNTPLGCWESSDCLIDPGQEYYFFFKLMELDVSSTDDTIKTSGSIGKKAWTCDSFDVSYTFKDVKVDEWATGDAGSNVELYVKAYAYSPYCAKWYDGRNRRSATDLKIIKGDCGSGECCNLDICKYRSSGSQPNWCR